MGAEEGWVADLRHVGFVTLRGVVPPEVVAEARRRIGTAVGWSGVEWRLHGVAPDAEQRQRSPIHGALLLRIAQLARDPDPEPAKWVIGAGQWAFGRTIPRRRP